MKSLHARRIAASLFLLPLSAQAASSPPPSPAELRAIALHPYSPGVVGFDGERGTRGISGRLQARDLVSETDLISATASEAAAHFIYDLSKRAWGWKAPERNLAFLTTDLAPVPVAARLKSGETMRMHPVIFMQMHQGIPIENRQASALVMSLGDQSGWEIGGYFGNLGPEPAGATDKSPALSESEAIAKVEKGGLAKARLVWLDRDPESLDKTELRLAYHVLVQPKDSYEGRETWIDAKTGETIRSGSSLRYDLESSTTTVPGPAAKWEGDPVTFPFLKDGSDYAIAGRVAPGAGFTILEDYRNGGWPSYRILRSSPDFTDAEYQQIRYGTDAFLHLQHVQRYYRDTFGLQSWDGRGSALHLGVNQGAGGSSSDQGVGAWASDSGNMGMSGGLRTWRLPRDGVPIITVRPIGASLTVVGHEFGHLIVFGFNPLDNAGGPNALHEGLANLSGELVSSWSSDWLAGELSEDGRGIVDMADPPNVYCIDTFSQYDNSDRADPHFNACILDKSHYLMVKGGTHYGVRVDPLDSDVPTSTDMLGRLVVSSLLARHYPSSSSLQDYAVGLYSWCRAPGALYADHAPSRALNCDTVRDAFTSTELLPGTRHVKDLALELTEAGPTINNGSDVPVRVGVSVRNLGTTEYTGTSRVEVRHVAPAASFGHIDVTDPILFGRASDPLTLEVPVTPEMVRDLPYDLSLVLTASNTDSDTRSTNNYVGVRLSAQAFPTGPYTGVYYADNRSMTLRLMRDGNFPLRNGDVAARFLYRLGGGGAFELGRGATSTPLGGGPTTQIPSSAAYPRDAGLPNMHEPLDSRLSAAPAQITVRSPLVRLGAKYFARLTLNRSGQLVDRFGGVVGAPVVLAMLNVDLKLKVNRDSHFLFCMNCQADDSLGHHAEYSIVDIADDAPVETLFPESVLPLARRLVHPPSPPWSQLASVRLPNFRRWLHSPGPDPAPIDRSKNLANPGFLLASYGAQPQASSAAKASGGSASFRRFRVGALAHAVGGNVVHAEPGRSTLGATFTLGYFPWQALGLTLMGGHGSEADYGLFGAQLEFLPLGLFNRTLEAGVTGGPLFFPDGGAIGDKGRAFIQAGARLNLNFSSRLGLASGLTTNLTDRDQRSYLMSNVGLSVRF